MDPMKMRDFLVDQQTYYANKSITTPFFLTKISPSVSNKIGNDDIWWSSILWKGYDPKVVFERFLFSQHKEWKKDNGFVG